MRLNNLVAKPFLLAAAFVLLAACHDDDKPEPEHEGEGQLIVTVENPGAQALALRIFGDGLTEPLESRFDAANATGKLDKWLPAGQYDALLTTDDPEAVTIDGTDGFATATATVRVPEGSTIMPALNTPVYVAGRSGISLTEGKTNELTLQPEDIRKILRLTVTAPDRQIAGSLDATLQGIARGVNLATEEITSSATLGMLLPTPDAQKVCSTTAGILGIAWPEDVDPGTSSDTHLLTLSWQGMDGKKQTYSEDVSSQLYRATEAGTDTLDLAVTIPEEIAKVAIHLYTGIRTRATVNIAAGNTAGQYSDSWEGEATDNEIVLSPRTLLSGRRFACLSAWLLPGSPTQQRQSRIYPYRTGGSDAFGRTKRLDNRTVRCHKDTAHIPPPAFATELYTETERNNRQLPHPLGPYQWPCLDSGCRPRFGSDRTFGKCRTGNSIYRSRHRWFSDHQRNRDITRLRPGTTGSDANARPGAECGRQSVERQDIQKPSR